MKRLIIALVIIVIAVAACSKHDDSLRPPLNVVIPSFPKNFTVTSSDYIVWDLSWTSPDPTVVRIYYIYTIDAFTGQPALLDSTTSTSVQYNTGTQPLPGLIWGASAISNDNVESSIVFDTAD